MNQHKIHSSITKIISGGQTGVDRAALVWAIPNNLLRGGWCPKGRRSEDGVISDRYLLQETESKSFKQRTKWNVRDSDATFIITLFPELTGGSLFTQEYTKKISKPCLHVYPHSLWRERIKVFLGMHSIQILNVAGPHASNAPDIEQFVNEVLNEALNFFICMKGGAISDAVGAQM